MKFYIDGTVSGYGVFAGRLFIGNKSFLLEAETEEKAQQLKGVLERVYNLGHGDGVVEMKQKLGLLLQ